MSTADTYLTNCILLLKKRFPEVPIAVLKAAFYAGVESFAWMKDGTTYVGTCGTRLAEVSANLEKIV